MPVVLTARSVLLFLGCAAAFAMAEVTVVPPADLSAPRRELIGKSLAFLKEHPAVPYVEGGADEKGMDCSGAIVRLLELVKIELPRSAQGQYDWLRESGRLNLVPATARTPEDPAFRNLLPGDLVFWAHDQPGEPFRVSHVQVYLGKEADGHAVMIGSSDGRSYRGKKLSGFGIVDYRVPKAGSSTRIAGFGSPFPATVAPLPDPAKVSPGHPSPPEP